MTTRDQTISSAQVTETIKRAMAAPLAVLIIIPLLVVGTGLMIGMGARTAIIKTVHELVSERFSDRAAVAERDTMTCLQQVDPLLASAQAFVQRNGADFPVDLYARVMSAMIDGRTGLTYTSFADPSGHFVGVFVDPETQELRCTDRRVQPDGKTLQRDYRIVGQRLELISENPDSGFDPRRRPWYVAAEMAGRRIWTDPYIWYASRHSGITCAEPVLDASGTAIGYITVDFDFDGLSRFVQSIGDDDTQTFIFTAKKELVAFPGLPWESLVAKVEEGKVPMIWDLKNPVVDAVLDVLPANRDSEIDRLSLQVGKESYLAGVHRLHLNSGIDWMVVTVGSTQGLLGQVESIIGHAKLVSIIALAVALLVSIFFAWHLVQADSRARSAELDARQAKAAVDRMGAYRLLRKLGEGGMGEVWLGEHSLLKRPVAVKLVHSLNKETMDDDEYQRAMGRFQREARTLASLNSRNTIEIFDFGVTEDSEFFYVMELLDGVDIHDLVTKFGVQPLERVINILEQCALSLAEAHDHGLVHRDIKPANIYLCRIAEELDVVKVLDFGMVRKFDAKAETRLTIQGTVEGTPAFMAPEQAQDKRDIDGRADLYALACVGIFMLTGRELFERETPMATLVAHVSEPVPDLQVLGAYIPAELEDLLLGCLAKQPDDRPADMRAFIEELREIPIAADQRWDEDRQRTWWSSVEHPRIEADDPKSIRALRRADG